MYKNILIPLDGSILSEQALRELPNVAETDAIVYLIQVIQPPEPIIEPEALLNDTDVTTDHLITEAFAYLNGKANELRLLGFDARTDVLLGDDPAYQIVSFAHDKGSDLIIMSTHGRSGLTKMVFGSVTNAVVRQATCPVLVIRPA